MAGLALLALGAGGCATRGAVDIACNGFKDHLTPLPPSPLANDIHGDGGEVGPALALPAPAAPETTNLSPIGQSIAARSLSSAGLAEDGAQGSGAASPNILLLSGGGQWGAFGAGFLGKLQAADSPRRVDFGVITGVSTGALQALFVAAEGKDPQGTYRELATAYRPKAESEIVRRNSKAMAVITGSFAAIDPLRARIEAALCTGGDADSGCPLIEAIAHSGRDIYIGFVNAGSGDFEYLDVGAIARNASRDGGAVARRNAQQCLTGAALASAAMPVFFQQVKINGQTYYDGGVRLSVFEESLANDIELAHRAVLEDYDKDSRWRAAGVAEPAPPTLYVVRNGPTRLLGPDGRPGPDYLANDQGDALVAASRAEAILVNQLEVGAIASLRVARPKGPIWIVTANGFDTWLGAGGKESGAGGCTKPSDVMFDPPFMACLQQFGAARAGKASPWRPLPELPLVPRKP